MKTATVIQSLRSRRGIFLFLLLFTLPALAQDAWERGNAAYLAGNYPAAIEAWESLAGESHKLYYNLGNAYFKNGELGRSIVLYNKALRLRPGDRDARFNLAIARSRVRVRIEPVPRFFMSRWVDTARGLLSGNGWAVVSLIMLAATLAALLFYLLGKQRTVRKSGFYGAIVAFLIFLIVFGFALRGRREARNPSAAVVMSEAATVKTAPDTASPDAFILYEGTEIRITGQLDDWREVEIADGNKGWIAASAIEIIR